MKGILKTTDRTRMGELFFLGCQGRGVGCQGPGADILSSGHVTAPDGVHDPPNTHLFMQNPQEVGEKPVFSAGGKRT